MTRMRSLVAVAGLVVFVAGTIGGRADAPVSLAAGVRPAQAVRLHVVAHDYALEAPDSVRAGRADFELENRGKKDHELIVGVLRPGMTASDIVAAHQRGTNLRQLQNAYLEAMPGGALLASPGTSAAATLGITLTRGRTYVLLCQLRDTVGAPQHALLGMFRLLHVR